MGIVTTTIMLGAGGTLAVFRPGAQTVVTPETVLKGIQASAADGCIVVPALIEVRILSAELFEVVLNARMYLLCVGLGARFKVSSCAAEAAVPCEYMHVLSTLTT